MLGFGSSVGSSVCPDLYVRPLTNGKLPFKFSVISQLAGFDVGNLQQVRFSHIGEPWFTTKNALQIKISVRNAYANSPFFELEHGGSASDGTSVWLFSDEDKRQLFPEPTETPTSSAVTGTVAGTSTPGVTCLFRATFDDASQPLSLMETKVVCGTQVISRLYHQPCS